MALTRTKYVEWSTSICLCTSLYDMIKYDGQPTSLGYLSVSSTTAHLSCCHSLFLAIANSHNMDRWAPPVDLGTSQQTNSWVAELWKTDTFQHAPLVYWKILWKMITCKVYSGTIDFELLIRSSRTWKKEPLLKTSPSFIVCSMLWYHYYQSTSALFHLSSYIAILFSHKYQPIGRLTSHSKWQKLLFSWFTSCFVLLAAPKSCTFSSIWALLILPTTWCIEFCNVLGCNTCPFAKPVLGWNEFATENWIALYRKSAQELSQPDRPAWWSRLPLHAKCLTISHDICFWSLRNKHVSRTILRAQIPTDFIWFHDLPSVFDGLLRLPVAQKRPPKDKVQLNVPSGEPQAPPGCSWSLQFGSFSLKMPSHAISALLVSSFGPTCDEPVMKKVLEALGGPREGRQKWCDIGELFGATSVSFGDHFRQPLEHTSSWKNPKVVSASHDFAILRRQDANRKPSHGRPACRMMKKMPLGVAVWSTKWGFNNEKPLII